MNRSHILFPVCLASLLLACGGGSSSSASSAGSPSSGASTATRLSYTNPPASSGFSLQVEPATNNTSHVVLDLVGPNGTPCRGVAFFLSADASFATWGSAGGSDAYAAPGSALRLGSAVPFFRSKQPAGTGDLQVGVFETGGATATLDGTPIVSLALDLKAGQTASKTVTLGPTTGTHAIYQDDAGVSHAMVLAVGQLTTK